MRIAVFEELAEGGAKRVVLEQVKRLKERGHKVNVFNAIGLLPKWVAGTTPPRGWNRLKTDFFKFYTLRRIHQRLAEEIDKKGFDVVLVHPSKYTQGPYLLRYLKTPSVYFCEEPLRIAYEYNLRFNEQVSIFKKIYEKLTRLILKRIDLLNTRSATKILANSYYSLETIYKAYGVYPQVCYLGVDTNHFKPSPEGKKEGILFVSRPEKITGFDFLKEAISLVSPKPKLRVVKGDLSEEELVKAYNKAVVTVCTSEVEPFGLVPLESMACGTPVVAVKEGGFRESIIDGVTGFLVDRNPQLFAQKIKLLFKNQKLAQKMGKAARVYVKKEWSWEKHIEKLEKILNTWSR